MNKILLVYIMLVIVTGSLFCKSQSKSKTLMATDIHSSQNSLDWEGTYLGVLPCDGCQGMQETVYLYKNGSYRIKIKYLGKEGRALEKSGKLNWSSDGNSVTLDWPDGQAHSYLVGENTLTQLDTNGNKIKGELAARYILSKERYAILEKYWKLVELNGKLVTADSSFRKEPHIIFKEDGNRFTGNGGCNDFSGTWEFGDLNRISLSQAITTRMACPSMGWESEFLKTLSTVDNYDIMGDRLVLIRDRGVPLAKFKVVHKK